MVRGMVYYCYTNITRFLKLKECKHGSQTTQTTQFIYCSMRPELENSWKLRSPPSKNVTPNLRTQFASAAGKLRRARYWHSFFLVGGFWIFRRLVQTESVVHNLVQAELVYTHNRTQQTCLWNMTSPNPYGERARTSSSIIPRLPSYIDAAKIAYQRAFWLFRKRGMPQNHKFNEENGDQDWDLNLSNKHIQIHWS